FAPTKLRIRAQILQPVQTCLMANCERSRIRTIYTHPQVLGQCRDWLRQNFPQAEQVATASTTAAALYAAEHAEEGAAALGSPMAASRYGLRLLAENIQDNADNTTRFAVIGKHGTQPGRHDRTTLCFSVPHVAGSLVNVLLHFQKFGINLLCLNSRPTRDTAWEYLFYADVEGHELADPLKSCLEEMHRGCAMFKVLGSYPEL
ncbi:MAG: prephenate dehydratase, partial [Akkermansia sp.]